MLLIHNRELAFLLRTYERSNIPELTLMNSEACASKSDTIPGPPQRGQGGQRLPQNFHSWYL